MLIFFVISFFTNILGALNPSVSESFGLNKTMVSFLPFSFFIAYGLMSIPSGLLLERYKEKRMLLAAFILCVLASACFVTFPSFGVFMFSLFTIGTGMAMLQVIINPLLRIVGGEEHYAFYSVMAQLVFGLASFISPQLYTWLVTSDSEASTQTGISSLIQSFTSQDLSWVGIYVVFAIIAIAMIVLVGFTRFPKVELKADEQTGQFKDYLSLLKNKTVIVFFFGIFFYVGAEQGTSYWMSKFLSDYHGFDFETDGALAVANFWGLMTLGGILGLLLIKLLDSKIVLKLFTLLALISLLLGLFGNASMAFYCLPATGFFMSVMYPIIISLALNSVKDHHGSFAGILMSGIMGGAVIQLLIGVLGDGLSLQIAMLVNSIALGYIGWLAFWAKPLVSNKTFKIRTEKKD